MTLARISIAYLARHKLATALTIALAALGVSAFVVLLLTGAQLEERLSRDRRDVDLVVGPKGSRTQIVLSTLYDLDVPAGSIPWSAVEEISAHPGVRAAIPLVLGDNYYGFRIVGTTPEYLDHYGARLEKGRPWQAPLEAVLGSDVAARLRPSIGSTFVALHGLTMAGAEKHDSAVYRIVGVLAPTGTLVDRLVLTEVASYWMLHPPPQADETGLVTEPSNGEGKTISAILVKYGSATAAKNVPVFVDARHDLQAASPARETGRLLGIVAVNLDLLRGFAVVVVLSAVLSIFLALHHGLSARRYDLAVMRTLGASRRDVMSLLVLEGVLLALAGALTGLGLGHLLTSLLGFAMRRAQQLSVTGWTWHTAEPWIVAAAVLIGVAASVLPAWRARDIDIAGTLARG